MTAYNFTLVDTQSSWLPGQICHARAYFDVSTTSGGSGLVNADTITATGIVPANGVEILEALVVFPEQDTNSTPTGTFQLGDSGSAARFISSAALGVNGVTTAGYQIRSGINIITTTTSGVIVSGAGYRYTGTSVANLVMTINAAIATAATIGIIHLFLTYRCVGNS